MVREKAFHLKVRKKGIRWGCPCCSGPVGRDAKKLGARQEVTLRVRLGKVRERRLFVHLVQSELDDPLE